MSTEEAVLEAARFAVDTLLDLVPVDVARQLLDEQAVKRANVVADAAEIAKFGTDKAETD